jgi:tetraacyldisaccharide 4'-kinase
VLSQLSRCYAGLAALRRSAYEQGWLRATRLEVPVVSVGALRAGGSGKTPVAALLAARLAASGRRVGVVSGGYRGRERARAQIVPAAARREPDAAARFGDEAVLLAGWLGERGLVVAGADKLAAARQAAASGAEVVVVDDGFQHLRLARDLDVLLEDEPSPPFPLGDGREGAGAAARADLRWYHRRDGGAATPGSAPVASRYRPAQLIELDGEARREPLSALRGQRVCLLAGIARPGAFAALVTGLGATVCATVFVGDHRVPGPGAFARAARSGADLLLCTEKDAPRLLGRRGVPRELHALRCEVELCRGEDALALALAGLHG